MSNLDLKFYCDDLDEEVTIRQYLHRLLWTLWKEEEGFSGKRPLGNSGWRSDLAKPLVLAGVIEGSIDADEGYLEDCDDDAMEAEVFKLINELCGVEYKP